MAEDKRSLLQRFIIWREKKYQGKAVHTDSQFSCRYLYGIRRTDTESHHTLDTELPDG